MGCRVEGLGFAGLGFMDPWGVGLGLRAQGFGLRVSDLVQGSVGFGGLGFPESQSSKRLLNPEP